MISVCIATFNGEKFIPEQLNSILPQLNDEDEIIISDDSSTDNTINIIKSYKDNRIKILSNNKFHSPVLNFENAIKQAKGEFIFLCDQDDVWLPNKIMVMKEYLKKYTLVVSDCNIVDTNLNIIEKSFFKLNKSYPGFWKNLYRNSYIGCCMAFRKEILAHILPFPHNIPMHDIWIGLLAELNGNVHFIDEPLMLYRRHGNNASFSGEKSKYSFSYKIKYRITLLFNIIKRQYFNL